MSAPAAKRNLLDRTIEAVAPAWALRREEARAGLSDIKAWGGYEGTYMGRERPYYARWRAMQADEDAHVPMFDRVTLTLTLQDMRRNNEIFFGITERLPNYVVHTGIYPMARTSSKPWNKDAEGWYRNWMKVCDYRQRPGSDMVNLQKIAIRNRIISGETGFIFIDNGQLQPVEMDRVSTPKDFVKDAKVRDGIKYDGDGRMLGYFVCDRAKGGFLDTEKFEFVPRENFLHIANPWRFDQARGIPEAASLIGKLSDLREADKYTLLKLKNDAKQFLKRTRTAGGGFANETPRASRVLADPQSNKQQEVESHEWGQVWNLKSGDDLQSFESRTPGQYHIPYMEFQCKQIGAALSLPWEFVLMVFTGGSFSAQRTALMHALHTFMDWHAWLSRTMNARIWNWRIAKAMKDGELELAPRDACGVSEWHKCEWSLPSMGWVDPEAAQNANALAWNLGNKSLKRTCADQGGDRDEMLDEKASDIEAALSRAKELNAAYPEAKLSWRDIINPATSVTDKASVDIQDPPAPAAQPSKVAK